MSDSGSLQNLHDIVVPGPVGWWPLAPGWYVVGGAFALLLLWAAVRAFRHWRRNRYRGQALNELVRLRRQGAGAAMQQLPVLLKRAALSAWPRGTVARLTGEEWHRFLDETGGEGRFVDGAGPILDRLVYGAGAVSSGEAARALDAAEAWLRSHRRPPESC